MKHLAIILILALTIQSNAQVKHIITSDSVDLYVTVKGKGTPLLYVHGGPGSGSYWIEKFMGDTLEKYFQVIYLDQRGCCRSTSPKDNNYSIDRMVQDFEEVRKALGIKSWLTMGHSFGGLLQMGYVQRYPKVIKGMIMMNCVLNVNESYQDAYIPNAAKLLNIDTTQIFNGSMGLIDKMYVVIKMLQEKDLMWKMMYKEQENFQKMGQTFSEIPNWNWGSEEYIINTKDYYENFKQYTKMFKKPVLFFYGKYDLSVGPEHYIGVNFPKMMLWGSEVGHSPFLENKPDLSKAIHSYCMKYKL
jgi:proline iminopeptidase